MVLRKLNALLSQRCLSSAKKVHVLQTISRDFARAPRVFHLFKQLVFTNKYSTPNALARCFEKQKEALCNGSAERSKQEASELRVLAFGLSSRAFQLPN